MNILGVIDIKDWFLVVCLIVLALYIYTTWHKDWWTDQNVPGPKQLPFLLSFKDIVVEGFQRDTRLTKEHGGVVGIFEGREPAMIVTDDDFLREVLVKQFHNFTDRRDIHLPEKSKLKHALSVLTEDQGWKRIRDLLSPAFSSGKLKQMVNRINECSDLFVKNFGDVTSAGKEVNAKEIFSDVTMSLIASVAFGLDLENEGQVRTFSSMGRQVNRKFTDPNNPMLILLFVAPKVASFLLDKFNIELMDAQAMKFFQGVVSQTLEYREKGEIKRPDLIQAMLDSHKEMLDTETIDDAKEIGDDITQGKHSKGMTRDEILSNGILFFLAGFDTVSTALSFMFYSLAVNPEYQQKLYDEIAAVFEEKRKINYNDVQRLTYLDWCLNEGLRMYPPAARIERKAKEEITINGVRIKKNCIVNIPLLTLHYDEKEWPNPYEFQPDRFSEEAKRNRSPFSWMPFGYGPRHCIGMRLALLEAKIVAAHMVYHYRFEPSSNTQVPFKLSKFGVLPGGKGLDFRIVPRN